MAQPIAAHQVQNLQTIEAAVQGPDGANRLFIITGQVNFGIGVFGGQGGAVSSQKETLTLGLGPVLTRRQFVRASASASLTSTQLHVGNVEPSQLVWQVVGADADWDDEGQQTELRVEVNVAAGGAGNYVSVGGFAFQVTVLAEMPS